MKSHLYAVALCGCALAAVAACSVGPAYRRPDIAPPAQWRDAGEDAAALWPSADWWHGFGSEKLNELIIEAQLSNDDLAGAVARVQEADAQARIAGAALLPSLDLGANATRERAPVAGVGPATFNNFNPELTASYELDFWGKNRALRSAARATAIASRFDQQTVALTVISSVATAYFQALQFRDRLQVARENLANGREILRDLQLEETAGIATGLDVAQQETAVARLNAAIPPLQQQLRQTVNSLAVLIGKATGIDRCGFRTARCAHEPAGGRRPAFAVAGASTRRGGIGAAVDCGQRRYHRGASGIVSEHSADRERRLRERRADIVHQPGQRRLGALRRADAADIPRRRFARSSRLQQCSIRRIAQRVSQNRDFCVRQCRKRIGRGPANRGTTGAPARGRAEGAARAFNSRRLQMSAGTWSTY